MTRLALAPLAHHWPRPRVLEYYEEVAALPFAVVYVGEVVCSKRATMRMKDWLGVAERLQRAGKEVVIAGKPAIESGAELRMLAGIAAAGQITLEVNDLGLLGALPAGTPFVAGAHLGLYNGAALRTVAERGARRWVAPHEMDRHALAALAGAFPGQLECEVHAFGRIQLAYSAQCFTAKTYLRTKRNCEHCCLEHPEGQRATTLDDRPLLVINGPQTLSAQVLNLAPQVPDLQEMEVSLLRIDPPRTEDTAALAAIFSGLLEGRLAPAAAGAALDRAVPQRFCNGYWFGRAGAEALFTASAASGGM